MMFGLWMGVGAVRSCCAASGVAASATSIVATAGNSKFFIEHLHENISFEQPQFQVCSTGTNLTR
jgi:hypothetical protein